MALIYPDQFLGLPPVEAEKADVVLLPLPFEKTVSYGTGTWRAPRAILDASCQIEVFDEETGTDFENDLLIHNAPAVVDDNEGSVRDYLRRVEKQAAGYGNAFLISVGGEHSVTNSPVTARAADLSQTTIVQIDAHADLIDQLDGETYSHGTVMRRLHEKGCRIIQIGVRSLSKEEFEFQEESENIHTFFAFHLQERWQELMELLRSLSGDVYFTFDIDGLDPSVIPTTGTPQPDGLSWRQAMELMRVLFSSNKCNLIGADLVEYIASPHPPGSDIIAAKIIYKMIAYYTYGRLKNIHNEKGL